jgi:hypothetical protein
MALWDFLPDSKDSDADKKAVHADATALQWWIIILERLIFRGTYAFILENVLRVLRQVPQQLCCVTALGDNELQKIAIGELRQDQDFTMTDTIVPGGSNWASDSIRHDDSAVGAEICRRSVLPRPPY